MTQYNFISILENSENKSQSQSQSQSLKYFGFNSKNKIITESKFHSQSQLAQPLKPDSIFNHQSDDFVIQNLKNLFQQEKKINEQILIHLQEVQNRRLYAKWGYSSLFDFLVKHFHQSETSAYQRIKSIKFIQSVPEANQLLATGEVTMSTLSEAQSVIQQIEKNTHQKVDSETKEKMLEAIRGKSKKESQKLLSKFNPYVEIPKNKENVITDQLTKLEIVIDESTQKLLSDVKSLLSHEIYDSDLSLIFKKSLEIANEVLSKKKGISKKDKSKNKISNQGQDQNSIQKVNLDINQNLKQTQEHKKEIKLLIDEKKQNQVNKKTDLTTDGGVASRNKQSGQSRYISIKEKREVFSRAKNCCEFISKDGIKCESRYQLQIDHIIPFSIGGDSKIDNLQLLCRTHNLLKGSKTNR